jgi:ABC-2 type transport system permease protein
MSISVRAWLALCERDLWVTVRDESATFLAQALLQPLFFLFVFGRVLPAIGAADDSYAVMLLPGVMALTVVLTSLQNTALPLVIEFSYTKEIEDRLLAPLPTTAVAVQKVVIAALRGIVAGLLILPLGALILPSGVDLTHADVPALAAILVVGALVGGTMGMVLGTAVAHNHISIAFAIVLTPLIFTGATFYSWASLDSLPVFQIVTLANPLTYVSEGLRASLTGLPHMGGVWIAVGLTGALLVLGALSDRGFKRRAVE